MKKFVVAVIALSSVAGLAFLAKLILKDKLEN